MKNSFQEFSNIYFLLNERILEFILNIEIIKFIKNWNSLLEKYLLKIKFNILDKENSIF